MKRKLDSPPHNYLPIDLTPSNLLTTSTGCEDLIDHKSYTEIPLGVDVSVWEALPEDIREEVKKNSQAFVSDNEPRKIVHQVKSIHLNKVLSSENKSLNPKSQYPPFLSKSSQASLSYGEFTDTQFVAGPQSIDGRRDVRSVTPSCKCMKTARLCRVSKDGVNQGRNFYGCFTRTCSYFEWADDAPHKEGALRYQWRRFVPREDCGPLFVAPHRGFRGEDVIQGGVGDCWFLSAVVVIAERRDLIERVIPQRTLRPDGSCCFMLFIDGKWTEVIVDNQLPCKASTMGNPTMSDLVYSKGKSSQLWVPLLEKAYAKAHGSYDAISGGFISEALLDLTAAPCETISFFGEEFDSEALWMKLVSYHQARFPMGCSTDSTGEGIIGNHAYSILDVREISDAKLGAQQRISAFLKSDADSSPKSSSESVFSGASKTGISIETLRLVRIRNPWGRVEWQGEMSKQSDLWTTKLATELGGIGAKNDGTFWMMYHDFLRRFTSVDICKCFDNPDWIQFAETGLINPHHFCAYSQFELCLSEEFTWLFIYVVQSTKRGKTRNRDDRTYWYSDVSVIISEADSGEVVAASFGGHRRDNVPIEVHLMTGKYIVNIVHFAPHRRYAKSTGDLFRLIVSSSKPIHLQIRRCADARKVPDNAEHFANVHHRGSLNAGIDDSISSINVVRSVQKCFRSALNIEMFSSYGANSESRAMFGLRYVTCKTQPKIVSLRPKDPTSVGVPEAERPRVHVLHGRGGIAFLVVVNTAGSAVECSLHVLVTHRSRLVSPYDVTHELGPAGSAADSSGGSTAEAAKQHLVIARCPQLSFMLVAAVIENSFLIESGVNLSVVITSLSNYCVTNDDAALKYADTATENAIFSPVQLLE